MKWIYDDGGRNKYYKGNTNDCVCRAISIAYQKYSKPVMKEMEKLTNKTMKKVNKELEEMM